MLWFGRFLYHIIRFFGPMVPYWNQQRVRLVLINDYNEVLLVKTWLSRQLWALPGGGIEPSETALQAIIRETIEETGLSLQSNDFIELPVIEDAELDFIFTVFIARVKGRPLPKLSFPFNLEIINRSWHPVSDLPPQVTEYTKRGIKLALNSES